MNLDDYREQMTRHLGQELVEAFICPVLNSQGKFQAHDWSDPYKRWGWQRLIWKIWYPVLRDGYQDCVRCGYTARRLR